MDRKYIITDHPLKFTSFKDMSYSQLSKLSNQAADLYHELDKEIKKRDCVMNTSTRTVGNYSKPLKEGSTKSQTKPNTGSKKEASQPPRPTFPKDRGN